MTWHGTLVGLFALLLAGGLGVPLPEDVTLIGAGALAQQHVLRLNDVMAVGLVGVAAADWIIYLIGRRYGTDLVGHPRLARFFGAARLEGVREAVQRHGPQAVFLARFVLGTRIVTFLAAGTFGVPALHFGIAEAAGTAIFVPATTTLGFLFAHQTARLAEDVTRAERWIVLAGLVGLAAYLALRAWAGRGLTAAARPRDAGAARKGPPPTRDRPL